MLTEAEKVEMKNSHDAMVHEARFNLLWPIYVKKSAHRLPPKDLEVLTECVKSALGIVEGIGDETKMFIWNMDQLPRTRMKNRVLRVFEYIVHPDTLKGDFENLKKPMVAMGRVDLKFSKNLAQQFANSTLGNVMGYQVLNKFYDIK